MTVLKKRTKFGLAGTHPYLDIFKDYLIIQKKFELISSPEDNPDFLLVGAEITDPQDFYTIQQAFIADVTRWSPDTPVLLLSSSNVYSDRDELGAVSETRPMAEDRASLLLSPLDPSVSTTLFSFIAEHYLLTKFSHVLILRVFELYGDVTNISSIIHEWFIKSRSDTPLDLVSPGYQLRSFLHVEDFFCAIDKLLPKFFKGVRGIYNIGSSEEISYKRLADSIWQLTHPHGSATTLVNFTTTETKQVWWKVPDTTRIKALLNWQPTMTLRRGLWRMATEG